MTTTPDDKATPADPGAVDWRAFALAMLSLLDEIERAAEGLVDEEDYYIDVHRLLRSRFTLMKEHGLKVEIIGAGESGTA